ncbi:hypothetical protein JRO89_XS01G0271800 [Xanthoceras sorbifolium]|uniref:C2H2-type domain-containing protein n=1 Tax=Xanthoceras sorbifolium TaxID=99658 RepID=A0ABQ8ILN8_9ROSI|nr:hypothetical protein JRO89_XS01G0271800 [Xanthoceras sorbifolium]
MFPPAMSNSTSLSEEASVSSGTRVQDFGGLNPVVSTISPHQQPQKIKKKRNLPGNPDPDAEVIALSPKTLLATNRFVCEICNKGFQRDQNLQLHRRGHNLPWKLKQRNSKDIKKRAYVCPEPSCVHHHPSRALGDLTEESARLSANQLATTNNGQTLHLQPQTHASSLFPFTTHIALSPWEHSHQNPNPNSSSNPLNPLHIKPETHHFQIPPLSSSSQYNFQEPQPTTTTHQKALITSPFQTLHVSTQPTLNVATSAHNLSATALLQKAATVGATAAAQQAQSMTMGHMTHQLNMGEFAQIDSVSHISPGTYMGFTSGNLSTWQKTDRLTRDFLGLAADANGNENVNGGGVNVSMNMRDVLTYTGGVELQQYERSLLKPQSFGFAEPATETWGDC